MPIVKQVKSDQDKQGGKAAEAFIGGAPDADAGVIRGKKRIITTGFAPDTVDRIDRAAGRLGISRAAWINVAVNRKLEEEGA